MKKLTCFIFLFAGLLSNLAQAQGFIQLGAQNVEDQGHRLIITSDGGYITAGSAGPNAVLYRTDCLGNLVAKIEKSVIPGPAAFWDVIELADGSILAVGGANIAAPVDSGTQVFLLKTTPMLVEIASATLPFSIFGANAQGKSIAKTASGQLLVCGEVAGNAPDFSNIFLQKVDPISLQPVGIPSFIDNGTDLVGRVLATADGNFLLTGSSFAGDVSNPDAPIDNVLHAYKLAPSLSLLWEVAIPQTFPAKYGVVRSCGAVQSSQTGNFVVGGNMFGGTDILNQEMFYALISNSGALLDTVYASAPGQQRANQIAENGAYPGLFPIVGDGDGSPLGVPSLVFAQAVEVGDQLLTTAAFTDVTNPVSIRDFAELDPGRFAYLGTIPDNPVMLEATDLLVITPEVAAGIVYQNCALAATLSGPAVGFQWLHEGQPIPGANQGVYFPTEPGLYQVGVLDNKGCFGVSDTFRIVAPVAGFTFDANNLTVTFTNTSTGADLYSWLFGDGTTSNQENPTHTYAANGVYNLGLIVRTQCGFADTIYQQVGLVSAKEPSWLEHFSLSPNPTNGSFTVEMSGEPQEKVAFALFNSVGQLMRREELSFQSGSLQKTFDLGQLPSGVYSLQIRSGNQAKNVRILRQ